jgi:hypothetical protein
VNTPVAVGRQFRDHGLDLRHKLLIRQWRATDPLLRTFLQAFRQIRKPTPSTAA